MKKSLLLLAGILPLFVFSQKPKFTSSDVFDLEYVSTPNVAPDGNKIVYVRNFKDIMTDNNHSNLWIINKDGSGNYPLTTGNQNDHSPLWSPDGQQILYVSNKDGRSQLYLMWLSNRSVTKLSNLQQGPSSLTWSPNGRWIGFTMFVPETSTSKITMPAKPEGAVWNSSPKYIDEVKYRGDGMGFIKKGHRQVFILSSDGGTPRQLTTGPYDYSEGLSWSRDGKYLYASSNQNADKDFEPLNTDIFSIDVSTGSVKKLTDRKGPDASPAVSPDGSKIAYLGFADKYLGYQQNRLYIMNVDGSGSREIDTKLDRSIDNIRWSGDGKGIFFQYDDQGNTKVAWTDLSGKNRVLAQNVGGTTLGRPYSSGDFHVSSNGTIAYTQTTPERPSDLAVTTFKGGGDKRLTALNEDLLGARELGKVEEVWFTSGHDGKKIQGWICTPPGFDPSKKYPLILEIHGGPFANYGDRFSAEIQLYAAAGYVTLYTNPRGSTSYGADFGTLIHHNYPGEDYDDLMAGVDEVIKKGYIDEERLYITGGSGGGVLTAWSVGKTDRFRAAVVAKPVINWYSFVLHADNPGYFAKYWFPGNPWDHQDHYMKRSPISLVGNVKTPTMLLTGEADLRTPMSETEQYYAALKLNNVPSAMVRIPGAGHGIATRPSNLIAKVLHILKWFEEYGGLEE